MNASTPSKTTIIHQLADASASLATAALRLSDVSKSIETQCGATNTPDPNFVNNIDSSLHTLQNALNQLISARVALAKTRNLQNRLIMSLPPEILSWIFLQVVYAPHDENYPFRVTMDMHTHIRQIYRRVHSLLGVCKIWWNIGITCTDMWRLVPLVEPQNGQRCILATKLSLQRAGNKNLHLAGDSDSLLRLYLLTGHWHRLSVINIWSSSASNTICNLFDLVIGHGEPQSLSSLSLNQGTWPIQRRPPPTLHAQLAKLEPRLSELINSLTTLRLYNVPLDWARINFSGKLVELWLGYVKLSGNLQMAAFLDMISSAHEIRTLGIVATELILEEEEEEAPISSTVSLPKLESLHLESLPTSFLRLLLTSISLGRCNTTLVVSEDDFCELFSSEGFTEDDLALLKATRIHRLVVSPSGPADINLRSLLESVPSVHSLTLIFGTLDKALLETLTPPDGSTTSNATFPRLETLELYNFECNSPLGDLQDEFEALLSGHSIKKMILGCSFYSSEGEEDECSDSEQGEAIEWMNANIPEFHLCPGSDNGPSADVYWQLWDM